MAPFIFPSRRGLMKTMVELIRSRTVPDKNFNIIEIGTTRAKPGDDVPDGGATVTYAGICKELGGTLYTVDKDPQCLEYSRWWTEEYKDNVRYILGDGREFLSNFPELIHTLYLDGPTETITDWDCQMGYSKSCLEACLSKMEPRAIVAFDDTIAGVWDGKASGCPPLLEKAGFVPFNNQTVWVRE